MKLAVYIFSSLSNREELEKKKLHNAFEGVYIYSPLTKEELSKRFREKYPTVIATIGKEPFSFLEFYPELTRRIVKFESVKDLCDEGLISTYMEYHERTKIDRKETPLLSVITSAYKSKERIMRPYNSLMNQTYK